MVTVVQLQTEAPWMLLLTNKEHVIEGESMQMRIDTLRQSGYVTEWTKSPRLFGSVMAPVGKQFELDILCIYLVQVSVI